MIVQSFGQLKAMTETQPTWAHGASGDVTLYGLSQSYAKLYATQPNVRTCVDFLARNIAQLGLHAYRRISDTDRERLADHDLVRWINNPNPSTRRYRLFESLIGDLGIYFNAYWLKVRYDTTDRRTAIGLVRLPPSEMTIEGGLLPTNFIWTVNGREKPFKPSEIVYFNGYNPSDPLNGLSPLETLRRVLAEEAAAGEHREQYWRNAGRFESVIEQNTDAPKWDPAQQQQFREQWQEYSAGGSKVGMTAVLPKGMTLKPNSFSAKDSEYLAARKLSREECAAAYHIPLPMVGILEHATFSNIKEQHKHLYQDCLGPWLEMIQEEIEGQLLVECDDQTDVYVEFNIAEKLKGSFEEQASSLHTLVGRPMMTANEGRARLNLPRIDDPSADELAEQQGGPATGEPEPNSTPSTPALKPDKEIDEDEQASIAPVIQRTQARQQARLRKLPIADRAAAFDLDRWNLELATDLAPLVGFDEAERIASTLNADTLARLEDDAMRVRVDALEQRPVAPTVNLHTSEAIVVKEPAYKKKTITLQRDASGAVTGAESEVVP